jgi:TIR domain
LRENELNVFSGENLNRNAGANISETINKTLDRSQNLILFCTNEAIQSQWVKSEYQTFYEKKYLQNREKNRFFILTAKDFNTNLLPIELRNIQATDSIENIIHALKELTSERKYKKNKLIIQEALFSLQNANYVGYFDAMDLIVPLSLEITYQVHKKRVIMGQTPVDFDQELEIFAREVQNTLVQFKQRFQEATEAEIPDLISILDSHYDQIPSHQKGTFNQLKSEFSDRPNNFTLSSWKTKMIVLIGMFNFDIDLSKLAVKTQPTADSIDEEINQIKKLFVQTDKNLFFRAISDFIQKYNLSEAEHDLLNLQADYQIFQREERNGVLSSQEAGQKNAQLGVRILNLIDNLATSAWSQDPADGW